MTTPATRARAAAAIAALLLLPLAACSAPAATQDDPTIAAEDDSEPAEQTEAASGGSFGCSEAVIAYANEYGYPAAVPLDPATFEIPLATFEVAPDCYLVDEETGATRYGAFWGTDPQGVLSSLGAALDSAGYVQSDDYGPLVWWFGGDDPLAAEHSISAAVQPEPIDGVEMLWATW